MQKFKVRIEGIAPLLQNRYVENDKDEESKKKVGIVDYSDQAEKALYKMENGVIYQPAEHIEKSMEKAATNFQIPGKRQKTFKDLVKSALIIEPSFIPHINQKFEIDRRGVRVQRARIMRERPRFDKWSLEFMILILDDQFPGHVAKEILDYAGKYVGLGDYRPKYGRFQVTEWKQN